MKDRRVGFATIMFSVAPADYDIRFGMGEGVHFFHNEMDFSA
jgi:hypothetical protein